MLCRVPVAAVSVTVKKLTLFLKKKKKKKKNPGRDAGWHGFRFKFCHGLRSGFRKLARGTDME